MSKLDQLKALGDAKRASRSNSGRNARSCSGIKCGDIEPQGGESSTRDRTTGFPVVTAGETATKSRGRKPVPKSSGGGVEVRHAKVGNKLGSVPGAEMSPSASKLVRVATQVAAIKPRAGVTPSPPEAKSKLRRGRPKITDKRPWEQEGMSRRTWYRRKAEEKAK